MLSPNWRHGKNILVPEAHAVGQLAVIRSLGAAGYKVHAISPQGRCFGSVSCHSASFATPPAYHEEAFLPWIRHYLAHCQIDAIVPSEAFLFGVKAIFDDIAPLLPVKQNKDYIFSHMAKADYFSILTSAQSATVRANCPPLIILDAADELPSLQQISSLGLPLFIKVDNCYSRAGEGDWVVKAGSAAEALTQIGNLRKSYRRMVIQGYIPGQKTGVNLCLKDGEVLAQFVMKADHESPHTGGIASLRQSWSHPAMLADAIAKARHLGWDGVIMMEYRWQAETDRFALVEINPRFWGYLHLCLYSQVDFPKILIDSFFGRLERKVLDYPLGIKARNLAFEVEYMISVIKDPNLSPGRKIRDSFGFLRDSLPGRIHSDTFYPGDRKVFFYHLGDVVKKLIKRN